MLGFGALALAAPRQALEPAEPEPGDAQIRVTVDGDVRVTVDGDRRITVGES